MQLDPISSPTHTSLGRFLYRARRYAEAFPHLKQAVELEPRSVAANFRLGDVYAQMGRYDEAIATFDKGRELTPEVRGFLQAGIARVHALTGRQREARQMISGVKTHALFLLPLFTRRSATRMRHSESWRKRLRNETRSLSHSRKILLLRIYIPIPAGKRCSAA